MDNKRLLNILKINGLNEKSSRSEVDEVLQALNMSVQDKETAFAYLASQDWAVDSLAYQPPRNSEPIRSETPETNSEVGETPAYQPEPMYKPEQTNSSPVTEELSGDKTPGRNQSNQRPGPARPKKIGVFILTIAILFLLVAGGVGAYAYWQKIGPFAITAYTEDEFLTSISAKVAGIKSASYEVSGDMKVNQRDAGAQPFSPKVSNQEETERFYENDHERIKDIMALLSQLKTYKYGTGETAVNLPYPKSLAEVSRASESTKKPSITDPSTGAPYEYKITDGGNNFELSATFQTAHALKAINRYRNNSQKIIVNDKTATFTKDSPTYFYLSSTPPKPLLISLSENMRFLPADMIANMSVRASSATNEDNFSDWKINFNTEGDFDDFTYEINLDALKKNNDYFFRINNLPSLVLGSLASVKGEWVKVPTEFISNNNDSYSYSQLRYLAEDFPRMEADYKKNKEMFAKLLKKTVEIAEEVNLVRFKNQPQNEKVNGRSLVRYELGIRKEAIIPFYNKLAREIQKEPELNRYSYLASDPGMIQYFESEEFNEVFEYINDNIEITIWTDTKGYPALIQNNLRVVPPDTAVQLSDKQINVIFKLVLSEINETVTIKEPSEAISIDELIKQEESNR